MSIDIVLAETDDDIRACFPLIYLLRPHLEGEYFIPRVRQQQASGYRLVCLRDGSSVKSVAGFRLFECLAWGKLMYIDDLVTEAGERRRGYGGQLLGWLIEHARTNGCQQIHLDSGYQRHEAHRFYLSQGFTLNSHHFALKLARVT
jgi:GNAT superfamily N-acetyltransferase